MKAFLRYDKEVQAIVGMTVKKAEKALIKYNPEIELRISRLDGEYCILTRDYRPNRINVAVVDGKITEIDSQG